MKERTLTVNDKQRMWLELITTTNLLWLKRRYDPLTIQRIMTIISLGHYDYFDQTDAYACVLGYMNQENIW